MKCRELQCRCEGGIGIADLWARERGWVALIISIMLLLRNIIGHRRSTMVEGNALAARSYPFSLFTLAQFSSFYFLLPWRQTDQIFAAAEFLRSASSVHSDDATHARRPNQPINSEDRAHNFI